ncbi:acyltransferase [Brachybacterium endophyticum]|uniref:Acyltransferase n=1 Tax=Brachybacterium endophyticum TaxID=2182385 RepID=A0A2U2RIK8_9MICO|nr:nitrilase-related carbon-nitrogen hydrolase [Brachybacterium endophyticum]PWH05709.1 acyltransferase [Brachybacterium endophyticum]
MRIALAQIGSTPSVEDNLDRIAEHVERAAREHAEIVVLPEASLVAFDGDVAGFAAHGAPRAHRRIAEMSARFGITVVVGSFEQAPDGRILNTLVVASPEGGWTSYHKIHLYDAFGYSESDSIAPGDEPVTLAVGEVRLGLSICYDVRFPELYRRLATQDAQVQIVAASWGDGPGKAAQWDLLTRARALDTGSWVIAADQAVRDTATEGTTGAHPLGVGHSGIVRPDGTDLVRFGSLPEMRVIDIDVEDSARVRAGIAVLDNARL